MPPRKKTTASTPTALAAGDEMSYSLSCEIRLKGQKMLVTFGSRTTLREGESPSVGRHRLTRWVEDGLDEKINDLLKG